MRRYLGLLRLFVANSIQLELEYRINLLVNAFNSLVAFGAGLAVIYAMFGQAGSIGGWSFHEAPFLSMVTSGLCTASRITGFTAA